MFDRQKPQEPRRGDAGGNTTESPERRRATRTGREKGCRVFIPAIVLDYLGIDPDAEPPSYSVVALKEERPNRRSVIVRLYPD